MPGDAWMWLGLVSPVLWAVWAFWPVRAAVVMDLGAERQRVRLRMRFFGMQAALEGRRGTGRRRGAPGCPGSAAPSVRVSLRILGFLRIERRLRVLEGEGHGETIAAWLRTLWSDVPGDDGRSLAGRLRKGAEELRGWAPWVHRIAGVVRRHLTVHRLHVRLAFGAGDAAVTGWLAGTVWGLGGPVWHRVSRGARFTAPPTWRVEPVFHARCLRLRVNGRMTIRQGWLGWMGAIALVGALTRRWTRSEGRQEGTGCAGGRP